MHILYIHQHFSTPAGSGGTRSYEFCRRLVASGHRVTMICGASQRSSSTLSGPFVSGRRRGHVDGIEVIEYEIGYSTADGIAKRVRNFLRFGWNAARHALTDRYDLIFTTTTPLTVAVPGLLAKWLRRKPFVFEVRDLWPEIPKALGVTNPLLLGGMSLLERAAYRNADHVIGLAPGIVAEIRRIRGEDEGVTLIPNGSDRTLFGGGDGVSPYEMFPDRIGPDDFVAIYAGAHGIANGLHNLLPVARELDARGRRDIKLLLIGNGATKPALVEQARAAGLASIVFADPIPKTALAALLPRCDAGLQILKNVAAFYEGTSPNKFFDYLAARLPIFVNYPGWVADICRSSGCGVAVPPDDPIAFADALEAAADDRAAWSARRERSAAVARTEFDRDRLAADFITVIEGVAARAGV